MGFYGFSTWTVLLVVFLPLALLPSIIAIVRKHPYKLWIILINIFGGLLWGLGWIIALVWSFVLPENTRLKPVAEEIEKLYELLEKGIISQQEFEDKKNSLLKT